MDYATPEFLGVRTGDGLYRFYPAWDGTAVAEHHIFSGEADQQAWQSWLTKLFT